MSICEIDCEFVSYNYETQEEVCSCGIKTEIPLMNDIKFDKKVLYKSFTKINNFANTKMMKCFNNVFKKKNILKNIGFFSFASFLLLNIILFFLFLFAFFKKLIGEIKKLKLKILYQTETINNISSDNYNNNNTIIPSLRKKGKIMKKKFLKKTKKKIKKRLNNYKKGINKNNSLNAKTKQKQNKKFIKTKKEPGIQSNITTKNNSSLALEFNQNNNIKNIINKKTNTKKKSEIELNNSELNDLEYEDAIIKDKRNFIQYYTSLLKMNHSILFIFNSDDYNSKIIKLSIFIFDLSSLITVNAIFFTDDTMHKIYIDKGAYNFIYQLPQTIYSAIISGVLNSLIKFLGFSESNILELKKGNNKTINQREKDLINKLKIKFIFFFIINFMLSFLFLYYVTCFCGIYRNTQIHLFKDSLLSFGTSLITPFIIYIFPAIFRICALKSKNKCGYRLSKILQII